MPSFDYKSEYLSKLIFLVDLLAVSVTYAAVVLSYPLLRGGPALDMETHFGLLPVVVTTFAISRIVFSAAVEIRTLTIRKQVLSLLQETGFSLLVLASVVFFAKLDLFSRFVLVGYSVTLFLGLVGIRFLVLWLVFNRKSHRTDHHLRVLIVGSGRRARMLADQIKHTSEWGVQIVGFLDPLGESAGRRASDKILGHVNEITSVLKDNVVEDVIVAVPRSMLDDVQSIIDACQEEGVRLRFMADIYDFNAARIRLTQVNDIPLLSFEPVARDEGALLAKRIFDITLTVLALPILIPIFVIVGILIRLDSPGPVFFTQDRIGLNKRPFKMYKFRSMVPDAEARMQEVEHLNEADGPNFKIENDPRITKLGRFIRRTSIDELPQLFNVLLGNMSLVGPRPMSKRDVGHFDKGVQRRRFSVRPGITCIWQISGRSDVSFDEWLEMDLEYIDNRSFWLDVQILFKTVFTVIKGSGAV